MKRWLGIGQDSAKKYAEGLEASEAEVAGAAQGLVDAAVDQIEAGNAEFSKAVDSVMLGAVGKVKTDLVGEAKDAGKALIDGLGFGITSGLPSLDSVIGDVGTFTQDSFESKFGIKSPARMTQEIGRQIAEGLAVGLTDGKPEVIAGAEGVGESLHSAFSQIMDDIKTMMRNELSDLIEGVITGEMTLGDALVSLFQSIRDTLLSSGIDTAVDWALGQVNRLISGAGATAAGTAAGTAATGAAAGASTIASAAALAAIPIAIGTSDVIAQGVHKANLWITKFLQDIGLQKAHFQHGGLVQGALGEPVPIVAHAGERVLTVEENRSLFDYTMFAEAVKAGVYDAMDELLPGKERPLILQVGETPLARVMYPALQREGQRLGLVTA